MARQITVTVKGTPVTFTTPHTNEEAWKLIQEFTKPGGPLANSSFAKDLIAKSAQYGLSERQKDWVHKLVVDAEAPTPEAPAADLKGVLALFASAKAHLKRPKITLQVGSQVVRLSPAGPSAKYPGAVYVTDGTFGGAYFGRIDLDGQMAPSRALTPAVRELLELLAADPVKVATEYGRLTGNCCFCSKALKDEKSTEVGYGPVCAERYNLPWGTTAAKKAKAKRVEPVTHLEADNTPGTQPWGPGNPDWKAEMEAMDADTPPGVGVTHPPVAETFQPPYQQVDGWGE